MTGIYQPFRYSETTMPEKLPLPCPSCGADATQRNGTHPKTGAQKLHCQECGAHFRATYQRKGWREGSARQMARRLYEGESVRSVSRALHLSPTTVQQRRAGLRKEFLARLQGHAERQILFESKTPLRYPGGKAKVLDILLPRIPTDIKEYREPFLGGGSMFLAVRSLFGATLDRAWINDLQPDLVHFWRALQQQSGDLVQTILALRGQHADGKALYRHLLWNFDTSDPLARAARAFILNRITFSGTIEAGGYSENAFQHRFTVSPADKLTRE